MTANISTKAIALAGISVLIAGAIAVVNTISQGVLFEVQKAQAATKAAEAELVQARGITLDAVNKLTAAIELAGAQKEVGHVAARAEILAAQITGRALEASTHEITRPENTMLDDVTKPLFADPTKKTTALNSQLVRLQRELEGGVNRKTRRALTDAEIAEKTNLVLEIEEELGDLQKTTAKNWSDAMKMILSGVDGLGGSYPNMTGDSVVPASRNPRTIPTRN